MRPSPEISQKYKQKICEVAKAFDAFCNEHNLRYFAIGGTAIGALRHKGIIPWDDDIDVVMPRPDYDRFLKLSDQLLPKYDVFSHINTPKYHLSMAKMCDASTSYLSSFSQHVMLGAFIDIFPIDGCPGHTKEERISFFNNYLKLRRAGEAVGNWYSFRDMLSAIYRRKWDEVLNQLRSHLYHLVGKENDIFTKCDNILKDNQFDESEYVAYFSTWRGPKVISPKEWFEDYFYAPFEDFQIRLPKGIHQYLTHGYGDYMTPPPPEMLKDDDHGFVYLNLNKRVSWQEAKLEYKNKKLTAKY